LWVRWANNHANQNIKQTILEKGSERARSADETTYPNIKLIIATIFR